VRQQILAAEGIAPRREADRYVQWPARAIGFDLDRAQPVKHTPGNDLATRAICTGEHHHELPVAGPADPIEAAQLAL